MFGMDDQRPMNSQFALRVAILGAGALIAFSIIFFRLWYLQVLSGDDYLVQAQGNQTREIPIQAPRGKILDRNGKVLVDNRTAPSLQVRPDQLPDTETRTKQRNRILKRLSRVSGIKYERIKREIRTQTRELPASPVTLKRDVDRDLVLYLAEHSDRFPGVTADKVSVRKYPEGRLASHLFGYVSEINEEQLELPQYDSLSPGDRIGAAGLEAQYDSALRGRNGAVEVPVDAEGNPRGRSVSEREPKRGNNLVLSVDAKIQRTGEEAIAQFGKPAAFVVMNVNDGAVLGLGSVPNFDPAIYTPPVSFDKIESLLEAPDDPLFNKAIQSSYPTGSTFKLITGAAGLEEGFRTPSFIESDSGVFDYGNQEWINAGRQAYGSINLVDALRVSSDIYFYKLGIDVDEAWQAGDGNAFNKWARQLGFGQTTGIDLPGEAQGLIPTPEWRNELYAEAVDPDGCAGEEPVFDPARGCYELANRPWSTGDMMNLSVGQGDLQATPLQLAIAYSTVANGGKVVRPHLAQKVEDPIGRTEQEFTPAAQREVELSEVTQGTLMEGIRQAAMSGGGTSAGIFGPDFPVEIAGKTGTAETPQGDQSWYAAVAPFDDPQIVVVVTVERGGFGSEAAAPAARSIIERWATEYLNIPGRAFRGGTVQGESDEGDAAGDPAAGD